jgi:polysaccharide deacetylase 2 family uncharacterized protein YibQ
VVARRLGMKIGERDIFLDNSPARSSINNYLNSGLAKAEQKGKAIMIGHASSAELASLLTEMYPGLIARGFMFSPVSKLIQEKQ